MKKPSVTQLIGMLDKPALLRWANRQGLQGIDIEKERARTKAAGGSLHEQIERREFADPLHAFNFDRFLRDKEILGREGRIETEWFVGRWDTKFSFRQATYVADYKSSRGVYFETKLQLVAYGMVEPCDRFAVVCIPDFEVIEVSLGADRQKFEDILIGLSKIWTLRQEIEAA